MFIDYYSNDDLVSDIINSFKQQSVSYEQSLDEFWKIIFYSKTLPGNVYICVYGFSC